MTNESRINLNRNCTLYDDLHLWEVVNGWVYNNKSDNYELFPFKVVSIDKEKNIVILMGLKSLGLCSWYEAKNKQLRFVFNYNDMKIEKTSSLVSLYDLTDEETFKNRSLISTGFKYWTGTSNTNETVVKYIDESGIPTGAHVTFKCNYIPFITFEIRE